VTPPFSAEPATPLAKGTFVNTLDLARRTYARPDTPARSSRDVEYELLTRITRQLAQAWANRATGYATLVAALHDNLQMWRTFAVDVAEPGNTLPQALRAKLYYLYEFTGHHSPKVLDGSASVEVLIDINTAVMRGLRGNGGAA
jgi:flagellar biosynthesis activator protein FlaF